jgi:hypothetical protein
LLKKEKTKRVFFVLSVDTEEEWNWAGEFPKSDFSVRNIQRIPKFQKFCNEIGARPTYFVDYAVASDRKSVDCLKVPFEKGECEIAAHLHPWCTPPHEEKTSDMTSHIVNLPVELVRRKLRNLTSKIEKEFGESPRSFRSGRWGINGEILQVLSEEGVELDSSVFPFYSDASFSYEMAPETPYWPDFHCGTREGTQRKIFEVPVTSGFNHYNFDFCQKVHTLLVSEPWRKFHLVGVLWRLGLLRKLYLSPEGIGASEMISCIKACIRRGHRVIHMFLHSSSLLPGATAYVRTDEDEERSYKNMADVIDYVKEKTDLTFCTLTEVKEHLLKE